MDRTSESSPVRVHLPRCPYCHEDVRTDDVKHGCPACMAWHHEACWVEAGVACSACGLVEEESDASRVAEEEDDEEEGEEGDEDDEAVEEGRGVLGALGAWVSQGVLYFFIILWGVVGALLGGAVGAGLSAWALGEANILAVGVLAVAGYVLALRLAVRLAGR